MTWVEVKPEQRKYAVFGKGKLMWGGTAGMSNYSASNLTLNEAKESYESLKTSDQYSSVGIYEEVLVEDRI